jgi:hypothetical protein
MIFCNPVPIAAACLIHRNVVTDGLRAMFDAIIDLTKHGKDIVLPFGFTTVYLTNKNLKVVFSKDFTSSIEEKKFEDKVNKLTTDEEKSCLDFCCLENVIQ